MRCGNSKARQTSLALWGNIYGKKLFLPDGIERIAAQIPQAVDLTAERFINGNTIFPLLKPFLPQSKCEALYAAMRYGDQNIYNLIGFTRVFTRQHPYLRYCGQCAERDTEMYGEPYWHRIHQLPGVFVCPDHGVATVESDVKVGELRTEYYPLLYANRNHSHTYEVDIFAKLLDFARDAQWLLQHGNERGFSENTNILYSDWLRVKGYHDNAGKTSGKRLAQDVAGYYGQEFLSLFDAYNSGACSWISRILSWKSSQHPMYHLLLIRFLAGSPETFFSGKQEKVQQFLPYGRPPYPCRNVICEYYLQDVIGDIEVVHTAKGDYKAIFVCPHCGFTYRRKKPLPKERQYTGQIDITEYGWLWRKTVTAWLSESKSPYKIARELHCDVRTILSYGIAHGVLPSECQIRRKPYVPSPREKMDFGLQREMYRKRWLDAISANPAATRNELRRLDSKADQWLHQHDTEWLEQNSPPSRKAMPLWADCDDEYLERLENAVKQIRESPGIPRRLSLAAIGRVAGITKPHIRLVSDYLPRTKSFVEANTEIHEQWQMRKILWAITQMRERGELLTVYKVRHAANIEDKERRLDKFILETINNSER